MQNTWKPRRNVRIIFTYDAKEEACAIEQLFAVSKEVYEDKGNFFHLIRKWGATYLCIRYCGLTNKTLHSITVVHHVMKGSATAEEANSTLMKIGETGLKIFYKLDEEAEGKDTP